MSTTTSSAAGPLAGVRVLDLTSVIFGPYASQILADYGADVIKVEAPQGDSTRNTGPRYEDGRAAIFLGVNRNKRSIVLDLKQESARQALLTLAESADVFMHSIRPQKMAAMGLGPDHLKQRNGKLIYAGLLGFGSGGPYEGRPAYDDTIQGLSGIADIMARQTGEARYLPSIAADKTCGLVAAHGILAALYHRSQTGQGQAIEIPMFEAMTSFNLVEHFYGRHLKDQAGSTGYPRIMSAWRKPYRTQDGLVCLMPYTDAHWRNFFIHSGHEQYAADPRFTDISVRTRHIDALYALAQDIVATESTDYWLALCDRIEVPATRVNTLDDLESDPHLTGVGLFVDVQDEAAQTYRFIRSPVRMEVETPPVQLPPRLGEHTREILQEAGLQAAQLEAMFATGAAR